MARFSNYEEIPKREGTKKMHKIKCNSCGTFIDNFGGKSYGKFKCEECLSIQPLQNNKVIFIPRKIREELGWKIRDKLRLVIDGDNLIIGKVN